MDNNNINNIVFETQSTSQPTSPPIQQPTPPAPEQINIALPTPNPPLPQQPFPQQHYQQQQQQPYQQTTSSNKDVPQLDTEDPVIYRRKLITKIVGIKNRFGHRLGNINLNNLELLDELQLEDLLREITYAIGVQNSCGFVKGVANAGLSIAESMVSPHLNGLGQALSQIPEYNDTIDEITLVYGDYLYTNPMLRLATIISTTAMQVYRVNNAHNAVNNLLKTPVVNNINNNYKDL